MSEKHAHFWGMLALAVALVAASLIAVSGAVRVKAANDTIRVTGSARMRVTSDYVNWSLNLRGSAPTLERASRDLAEYRRRTLAFLHGAGIADSLISVQPPNSWPVQEHDQRGRETGRIVRYQMNQAIEVRAADIALVTEAAGRADQLTSQGVPLNAMQPRYLYTKLDEARIALMADATRDARRRAEEIAGAAGGEVGPIRQARMGVIQVVAPHSTQVSDYGMYDTSTVEKDVVAVVKVEFAVH